MPIWAPPQRLLRGVADLPGPDSRRIAGRKRALAHFLDCRPALLRGAVGRRSSRGEQPPHSRQPGGRDLHQGLLRSSGLVRSDEPAHGQASARPRHLCWTTSELLGELADARVALVDQSKEHSHLSGGVVTALEHPEHTVECRIRLGHRRVTDRPRGDQGHAACPLVWGVRRVGWRPSRRMSLRAWGRRSPASRGSVGSSSSSISQPMSSCASARPWLRRDRRRGVGRLGAEVFDLEFEPAFELWGRSGLGGGSGSPVGPWTKLGRQRTRGNGYQRASRRNGRFAP